MCVQGSIALQLCTMPAAMALYTMIAMPNRVAAIWDWPQYLSRRFAGNALMSV